MGRNVPVLTSIKRFTRERTGNVAIMSGVSLPVMIVAAAFAVDEGSLYFERREAQALTDLAAITAAANIANAEAAAALTMSDNRQQGVVLVGKVAMTQQLSPSGSEKQLLVEEGRYRADPGIDPAERFVPGATPFNAVKVTYRKHGTLRFADAILDPPTIVTTAIAAAPAEAAFSIGSRLASVKTDASILSGLMNGLLGTDVTLSLADYQALANANIDVLSFLDALATEVDLTAGTYDDVLASEATLGQVLQALAACTGNNSRVRQLVLQLAGGTKATSLRIPLSHLLDIGSLAGVAIGQPAQGLQAMVGVMDLVGAAAAVANHNRQVDLNASLRLPGLAAATLQIAVGEPPQSRPWFAIGEAGEIVRTAQTRLYLSISVKGPGGVLGNLVNLPIYLELGYAEAELKEVVCSPAGPVRVSIDAKPGILEAWLAEVDASEMSRFDRRPARQPAKLVDVPPLLGLVGVTVKASAHVYSGNMSAKRVTFDTREIERRALKTVDTRNILQPLIPSLLNFEPEIQLRALGGGLGLVLPTKELLGDQLAEVLTGVTGSLDTLVYTLLAGLGVRVGEADIRVSGASCSRSVLVN